MYYVDGFSLSFCYLVISANYWLLRRNVGMTEKEMEINKVQNEKFDEVSKQCFPEDMVFGIWPKVIRLEECRSD